MRPSNNLENKIPLGTYSRRVQVLCSKISSLQFFSISTTWLWQIKVVYDFYNELESSRNIMQFQISF